VSRVLWACIGEKSLVLAHNTLYTHTKTAEADRRSAQKGQDGLFCGAYARVICFPSSWCTVWPPTENFALLVIVGFSWPCSNQLQNIRYVLDARTQFGMCADMRHAHVKKRRVPIDYTTNFLRLAAQCPPACSQCGSGDISCATQSHVPMKCGVDIFWSTFYYAIFQDIFVFEHSLPLFVHLSLSYRGSLQSQHWGKRRVLPCL